MKTVRVPAVEPLPGLCPIRPALTGQGNPMRWCALPYGHSGPHSWEAEPSRGTPSHEAGCACEMCEQKRKAGR